MAAQPREERKDYIKQARQRIHVVPVERQRTVYDEKGISYPRITTKPAKVPENEYSAPEDAVQVMTVHKSKGLEFDAVFIPKLENGEFPVRERGGRKYWHVLGGRFEERKDRYTSDLEDERKLFYVGVTRAKRYLFQAAEICKKAEQFIRDEREAIRNEKQEMQTLTEKELLIECMSALQTYASRLDRLENKMSNISISIDSVAKKVAKTKKPYTHVGAITDTELIGIVQEAAKRIGRIAEITVNDAVVQGIVLSQNKLSTWSFSIDFNDDGRLTGNYTVLSDNMDSTIPQRLAKEISKEILYRLNGKG